MNDVANVQQHTKADPLQEPAPIFDWQCIGNAVFVVIIALDMQACFIILAIGPSFPLSSSL